MSSTFLPGFRKISDSSPVVYYEIIVRRDRDDWGRIRYNDVTETTDTLDTLCGWVARLPVSSCQISPTIRRHNLYTLT